MKIPGRHRTRRKSLWRVPQTNNGLTVEQGAAQFRAEGDVAAAEMLEEMAGAEVGLTEDDSYMLVSLRRLRELNVSLDESQIADPEVVAGLRAQGLSDNEIMASLANLIRAGFMSAVREGDHIGLRLNTDALERQRQRRQFRESR
jgi:hypothetical protein